MQRSKNVTPARTAKFLAAATAAFTIIATALPAWADGDQRGPDSSPTPLIQDPFGDFGAAGHHGKLVLPPALIGDQSAEGPKFSFEFGYGAPPLAASPSFAQGALGGRTELRAAKVGVTFDF